MTKLNGVHMSNGDRMVRMPTYEMYLSGMPHRDGTLGLSFAKPRSSSWRASGALRIQLSRRAGGDWCCNMGVRREPKLFRIHSCCAHGLATSLTQLYIRLLLVQSSITLSLATVQPINTIRWAPITLKTFSVMVFHSHLRQGRQRWR